MCTAPESIEARHLECDSELVACMQDVIVLYSIVLHCILYSIVLVYSIAVYSIVFYYIKFCTYMCY